MRADKLGELSQIPGLSEGLDRVDELMLSAGGDKPVGESAARLIKTGGKRLRPALTLAVKLNTGNLDGKTIEAAAAIELLHLASLAHDTLIDKDDNRLSPIIKESHLLVLGDYLVASAFWLTGRCGTPVAAALAEAMRQMSAGEAAGPATPLSPAYLKSARQKTASLFAAACLIGGICGGLSDKDIQRLANFGGFFGTAFQLIDDISDGDISQSDTAKAVRQINKLNSKAASAIEDISGSSMAALRSLPAAYLAWASPL